MYIYLILNTAIKVGYIIFITFLINFQFSIKIYTKIIIESFIAYFTHLFTQKLSSKSIKSVQDTKYNLSRNKSSEKHYLLTNHK